jgi:thioredoxin-related protein
MKTYSFAFFLTLLLLVLVASGFKNPDKSSKSINWMTWEEVQKAQQTEPRKVFVDVYTEWCGWCKKMDKETLSHPQIVEYINLNYYAVKFDAETRSKIQFKGKEYKYIASGNRGYNELANTLLNGKMSYPSTVYLDDKLNLLTAVPGYLNPPTLDAILTFFNEGYFLTSKWDEFEKSYKTRIK